MCRGKKAYLSYQHAAHDARALRRKKGRKHGRATAYHCRNCGFWHVGNQRTKRPWKG